MISANFATSMLKGIELVLEALLAKIEPENVSDLDRRVTTLSRPPWIRHWPFRVLYSVYKTLGPNSRMQNAQHPRTSINRNRSGITRSAPALSRKDGAGSAISSGCRATTVVVAWKCEYRWRKHSTTQRRVVSCCLTWFYLNHAFQATTLYVTLGKESKIGVHCSL